MSKLFLIVILIAAFQVAGAQSPSRLQKQVDILPDDIAKALRLIESLRPLCAKQKDAFESSSEAKSRIMSKFQSPHLHFQVRPLLVRDDDNSTPVTRHWGGRDRGAVQYETDKQELRIRFPYAVSPKLSIYRGAPFSPRRDRETEFALLTVAERGEDLGTYAAGNAYGAVAKVEWDRQTYWYLAFLRPEDIKRMRQSDSAASFHSIPMPPEKARELTLHLAWEIDAKVAPLPEVECVVESITYMSRKPKLDDPWRQDRIDHTLPVELLSIRLLDTRTRQILWQSSATP